MDRGGEEGIGREKGSRRGKHEVERGGVGGRVGGGVHKGDGVGVEGGLTKLN